MRREVIRFLADDPQDVALPVIERGVFEEKQKDVALGLFGELFGLLTLHLLFALFFLEDGGRIDERIHVGFALEFGSRLLGVGIDFTFIVIWRASALSPADV